MQYKLADLLFFFLCNLSIESKGIQTDNKLSLVKTKFLSLRFFDLAFLSLKLIFHIFEFFLLSAGIELFIICLLKFGLLFIHLFLKVIEHFSIVLNFDSILVKKFFLEVWLDAEDWGKVWSELGESEKLEILVADYWRDVHLTLDLGCFSLLILPCFLLSRRVIGRWLVKQFTHNAFLRKHYTNDNSLLFLWGILELDNFLLF